MKKVLLIHQDIIQHYRLPVYNRLSEYLSCRNFYLTIISGGIQSSIDSNSKKFDFIQNKLGIVALLSIVRKNKPDAIIFFVNHSKKYYFPFLFFCYFAGIRTVTWTHGMDLQSINSFPSKLLHHLEHELCNGILLYADHLRVQLLSRHRNKAFVANNTLNLTQYDTHITDIKATLEKYGIKTSKNIICMGRLQKRKRIEDLVKAFLSIDIPHTGLVLAGPDEEGIAARFADNSNNIYMTGPVYGRDAIDLMRSCDIYCIPGAIGLSIVDAQYCGLPIVTEDVHHGPEIMYLKNGVNGFIVPKDNIKKLADQLRKFLSDENLRKDFSKASLFEYNKNAHIDNLCRGFHMCLQIITSS